MDSEGWAERPRRLSTCHISCHRQIIKTGNTDQVPRHGAEPLARVKQLASGKAPTLDLGSQPPGLSFSAGVRNLRKVNSLLVNTFNSCRITDGYINMYVGYVWYWVYLIYSDWSKVAT